MEANKNNAKKLTWKIPVIYNLNERKNIEGKTSTASTETTTVKSTTSTAYAPS